MKQQSQDEGTGLPDLVSTDWVANNLSNQDVCIVESNEDPLLYDTGHIPGALHIDWKFHLNDDQMRDFIGASEFARLCRRKGITPETFVVFYGDRFNLWAAYTLWIFHLFGHHRTALMDGGREKWIRERRDLTLKTPNPRPTAYPVPPKRDDSGNRAYFQEVREHLAQSGKLVDVRSPEEYRGEVTHMVNYPQEGVLRAGHIPGAQHIHWEQAINPDGTLKPADELARIYLGDNDISPEDDIITYCRIGERSSHTWFVLSRILGLDKVRNYDGSWTEWGNLVRAPVETGADPRQTARKGSPKNKQTTPSAQ